MSQTSHGFTLDWDLPIHTKFDDLDFVSKSRVCRKLANGICLRQLFHSCPILFQHGVAVSVVRCMEERARKEEAVSHQHLVVSQFIRALQGSSTNILSNRSNITLIKNKYVSSMFSRRKTHINRDLNEVQP